MVGKGRRAFAVQIIAHAVLRVSFGSSYSHPLGSQRVCLFEGSQGSLIAGDPKSSWSLERASPDRQTAHGSRRPIAASNPMLPTILRFWEKGACWATLLPLIENGMLVVPNKGMVVSQVVHFCDGRTSLLGLFPSLSRSVSFWGAVNEGLEWVPFPEAPSPVWPDSTC